MRILVWGAGAVGLALGGFLQQAGHSVWFRARPERMRVLAEQGLQISGIYGQLQLSVQTATDAQLAELAPDLVLVTVKAPALAAAAQQLAAQAWSCPILHFQNGIGNYPVLRRYLPQQDIYTGMIIIGFQMRSLWQVEVTVFGGPIRIGYIGSGNARYCQLLVDLFNQGPMATEVSPQIEQDLWRKLLYNAALNPLAALLGQHYGALLADSCQPILQAVIQEVFAVAKAAAIELPWQYWSDYYQLLRDVQIPATFAHQPSMLADLTGQRPTEIGQLNGAVCQLGAQFGVATPVNQSLVWLIRAREQLAGLNGASRCL